MSRPTNPSNPSPRISPAPVAPAMTPQLPRLQPLVSPTVERMSSSKLLPKKRSYPQVDWNTAVATPTSQSFTRGFPPAQGRQTVGMDNRLLCGGDVLLSRVTMPVSSSAPSSTPFCSSSFQVPQPHLHTQRQRHEGLHSKKGLFALPRKRTVDSGSFLHAAELGAEAQSALDSSNGRLVDTYHLGKSIISCSKLYANQRRSNRLLPGGSDSTTAACYMIGGTNDGLLRSLLERISPCDPREERCKAVERVLKDKTRGAICALNGENPREARADNLAAVRICETIADILVAYLCRNLIQERNDKTEKVTSLENSLRLLRDELAVERKRREVTERDCWCKGSAEKHQPSPALSTIANQSVSNCTTGVVMPHTMDIHSFERNKLLVGRGYLSSSGFRSHASTGYSLADAVQKETEQEANRFASQ